MVRKSTKNGTGANRSKNIAGNRIPSQRTLVNFRLKLLQWYEEHGRKFPWRKASLSKYQYVISEILLQRTRAETVASFFPRFIAEFPSWSKLDSSNVARLQSYLQPIGLWRQRASSIQALAKVMVKGKGRLPRTREEIEALPGVGQYITNAILLLCHGEAQPLLDGNMARVLERVFGPRKLADIRYDPYLQSLAWEVVQCSRPKQINWCIIDLAASVCLSRNPHCYDCPANSICSYAAAQGIGSDRAN